MSSKHEMFSNKNNKHEGNKTRACTFIALLCFQIIILSVCQKFMYSRVFIDIKLYAFSSKQRQNDTISSFSRSDFSTVFGFGTNATLKKFYYIPDSIKPLYTWKDGNFIPVDDSNTLGKPLIYNKEREANDSSSCTISGRNITSKTDLKPTNCTTIRKGLDDFSYYVFQEEIDVQIAYSILVHRDYEMMELLLRTIYKPQHTYCIHIDDKSPKAFKQRVIRLAACFVNVFIATKLVKVYWGKFSVLEAEMSCMKDLVNRTKSWKYFINLTGQEFPLRTNYEITKVLGALRGLNNMRCNVHYKKSDLLVSGPPPYNLTTYKSSTHVVLTRSFVEYLLFNRTARVIFNWSKKLTIPSDEIAIPTINCNRKLKAPGSFGDKTSIYSLKENYVARFKIWVGKISLGCHGKRLRGICTFGTKDLEMLQGRHELFANKFNIRLYPEVSYCLRSTLLERTYLEYTGRLDYNVSYYENIPFNL